MQTNKKYLPYLACLSSGLSSFYSILQFSLFNIISPNLINSFQLTSIQMGCFSGIFILANTLWLLPCGWLLDKYSVRPLGLIFIFLSTTASFILAISHNLPLSIAMRALQGMASAVSLLTYIRLALHWFPKTPTVALGLMGAFAALGGVFANTVFAHLVIIFGWRHALIFDSFIGLLFCIYVTIFLCERNTTFMKTNNHKKLIFADIKIIIHNLQNTIYGLYIGLMNLPVFLLASLWGVFYLIQTWHLSATEASNICALIFLGGIIGEPIFGLISDVFKNKQQVMMTGTILALICIITLIFAKNLTLITLALLFFGIGFFSSAQVIGYIMLKKINPSPLISMASSYVCLLLNIIGMLAQPLSGRIIEGNKTSSHYEHILIIIAIALVICLLLKMFMWDKKSYVNH